MHKQLSALLSAGGSPGQLAKFTEELAKLNKNIRSIGGSEWEHQGAIAVLIDDETDDPEADQEFLNALEAAGFPSRWTYAAEAILPDSPGQLAEATKLIDSLNILTVLVADTHLGVGLVSFGFATVEEAREAVGLLGDFAVSEEHDLTRAWKDHESWDQSNKSQNPAPDPHNPSRP